MVDEKKIDIIKNSKPVAILDVLIVAILVLAIVLILVSVYSKEGEAVEITYMGQKQIYPLDKDNEIDVDGKLVVVIKSKECYIVDADCPDKVCENSGKIKYVHQTLICSPNGIIIRIIGESNLHYVS